jgi:hypothetical protein
MWNIYYKFNSNWMPWYKFIFMIFRDWVISRDQEWSSSKITREILPDTPLFRTPEKLFRCLVWTPLTLKPRHNLSQHGPFLKTKHPLFSQVHPLSFNKQAQTHHVLRPQHPTTSLPCLMMIVMMVVMMRRRSRRHCNRQHNVMLQVNATLLYSVLNPWPSIISMNCYTGDSRNFGLEMTIITYHYIWWSKVSLRIITYRHKSLHIINHHSRPGDAYYIYTHTCVHHMYICAYVVGYLTHTVYDATF